MLTHQQIGEAISTVSMAHGLPSSKWLGTKSQGKALMCRAVFAHTLQSDYGATGEDIAVALGFNHRDSVYSIMRHGRTLSGFDEMSRKVHNMLWGESA